MNKINVPALLFLTCTCLYSFQIFSMAAFSQELRRAKKENDFSYTTLRNLQASIDTVRKTSTSVADQMFGALLRELGHQNIITVAQNLAQIEQLQTEVQGFARTRQQLEALQYQVAELRSQLDEAYEFKKQVQSLQKKLSTTEQSSADILNQTQEEARVWEQRSKKLNNELTSLQKKQAELSERLIQAMQEKRDYQERENLLKEQLDETNQQKAKTEEMIQLLREQITRERKNRADQQQEYENKMASEKEQANRTMAKAQETIARYQQQIEEIENRVKRAEDAEKTALAQAQELDVLKNELTQKDEALIRARQEAQNQISELERSLAAAQIDRSTLQSTMNKEKELQETMEQLHVQLDEERTAKTTLEQEMQQLKAQPKIDTTQLEALEKENRDLQSTLEQLERELSKTTSQLTQLQMGRDTEREKLQIECDSFKQRVNTALAEADKAIAQNKALQQAKATLEEQLKTKETVVSDFTNKFQRVRTACEKIKAENERLQKAQEDVDRYKKEYDSLQNQLAEFEAQRAECLRDKKSYEVLDPFITQLAHATGIKALEKWNEPEKLDPELIGHEIETFIERQKVLAVLDRIFNDLTVLLKTIISKMSTADKELFQPTIEDLWKNYKKGVDILAEYEQREREQTVPQQMTSRLETTTSQQQLKTPTAREKLLQKRQLLEQKKEKPTP